MLHNTAYQSIYTPPGGQVEWLVGVGVGHQEPVLAAPPRLLVVAVVAVHPQPVQDPPLAAVHLNRSQRNFAIVCGLHDIS